MLPHAGSSGEKCGLTFSGDPYQANLDLQAVYTVNSASLSDLVVDPSRNDRGRKPVGRYRG